jgi:2',3'-cyclic-nucleotide 2'-phosphodiesterase (5'-nucleotidase family)
MSTIKNLKDALDAQHDNVLLISAGDIVHGTTFSTLQEGASMIEVMNQVGYDLMVPGNHDFNYGFDRLLELEDMANFPMITANVQYDVDDSDFMNPYIIQEIDGVLIGFFGLTSPETVYKTHPDNVIGLNFLDPIVQATAIVAELDPLVDIIILVAHIGLDTNTLITSEDIAIAVPGIDVIIDGHSHSVLPDGMMVGDTLIVSTGEYMKNLGVLTLEIQNGEIIGTSVLLIDSDMASELNYGYDLEIQNFIDDIVADQAIILNEVVGQTAVELLGERGDVRTGETNLGNLIADSMIIVTGADVAITNGGGIRSSIAVGDVTLGDVITVLPFGNIIVTIELTGQEILDSLEHGTSAYPNAEGMFPHVAGMTFDLVAGNDAGTRVENLMINGVAVDLTATYLVATNDFMAAGGDGYVLFNLNDRERVGEFKGLHEALIDMFTLGVDIEMPTMGRINAID